jgi:hypothetical protein
MASSYNPSSADLARMQVISCSRGLAHPRRVNGRSWQAWCPSCGTYGDIVDTIGQATQRASDHNEDRHSIAGRVVRDYLP